MTYFREAEVVVRPEVEVVAPFTAAQYRLVVEGKNGL